jgi:hypothetical protein
LTTSNGFFQFTDYEFIQLFSVIFPKYLPEKNFSLSVNGMLLDVSGRI